MENRRLHVISPLSIEEMNEVRRKKRREKGRKYCRWTVWRLFKEFPFLFPSFKHRYCISPFHLFLIISFSLMLTNHIFLVMVKIVNRRRELSLISTFLLLVEQQWIIWGNRLEIYELFLLSRLLWRIRKSLPQLFSSFANPRYLLTIVVVCYQCEGG